MQTRARTGTHDDDDHDDDGVRYFTLSELAQYSRLSASTLKRYLDDPERPLPHLQVRATGKGRGRLLFRKDRFDAWLEQRFAVGARPAATDADDDISWVRRALRKD